MMKQLSIILTLCLSIGLLGQVKEDSLANNYKVINGVETINIGYLGEDNNDHYAEIIRTGRINLYQYTTTHSTWRNGAFENTYSLVKLFYTLDGSIVKEASYSNLYSDLKDIAECKKYLDKHAFISESQITYDIMGGAIAAVGLFYLSKDIEKYGAPTISLPIFAVAGSMFVLKKIRSTKLNKHLKSAVDAYNNINN